MKNNLGLRIKEYAYTNNLSLVNADNEYKEPNKDIIHLKTTSPNQNVKEDVAIEFNEITLIVEDNSILLFSSYGQSDREVELQLKDFLSLSTQYIKQQEHLIHKYQTLNLEIFAKSYFDVQRRIISWISM